MHLLIPLDEGCGVLHPLASPHCATGCPDEHLGRAADFVTALVNSGACKFYEVEQGRWVLEVRLLATAHRQQWRH
jgi:hypothetical protein